MRCHPIAIRVHAQVPADTVAADLDGRVSRQIERCSQDGISQALRRIEGLHIGHAFHSPR